MFDFDKMTTPELRAYARENFSTISKLGKRADLIRALEAQAAKEMGAYANMSAGEVQVSVEFRVAIRQAEEAAHKI